MRGALCESVYDLQCANMSSTRFYSFYKFDRERRGSWRCPECQSKQPKNGNLDTPIRGSASLEKLVILTSPQQDNVTKRTKKTIDKANSRNGVGECEDESFEEPNIPEDPMRELKQFWSEMRATRNEFGMLRSVITELRDVVISQSNRIETLEAKVETLEEKLNEAHRCETSGLEETILSLRNELEMRDQVALANDVELVNFPEVANENPTHVILAIAKKLSVELEERDVVSAHRVGAPRAAGDGGAEPRPRPLAVRMSRRATRAALLHAARVRRRLDTEGFALPGPSRSFYINERLTRHNRLLFQRTREAANRAGWKYVWSRDGKIFARRDSGTPRQRIVSDSDLSRVFGG